jgi:hypothetical protein
MSASFEKCQRDGLSRHRIQTRQTGLQRTTLRTRTQARMSIRLVVRHVRQYIAGTFAGMAADLFKRTEAQQSRKPDASRRTFGIETPCILPNLQKRVMQDIFSQGVAIRDAHRQGFEPWGFQVVNPAQRCLVAGRYAFQQFAYFIDRLTYVEIRHANLLGGTRSPYRIESISQAGGPRQGYGSRAMRTTKRVAAKPR